MIMYIAWPLFLYLFFLGKNVNTSSITTFSSVFSSFVPITPNPLVSVVTLLSTHTTPSFIIFSDGDP